MRGPARGRAVADDDEDYYEDEDEDDDDDYGDDDEEDMDVESEARHRPSGRWGGDNGGRRTRPSGGAAPREDRAPGTAPRRGGSGGDVEGLALAALPAIYKTAEGARTVDIPLSGVRTVRGLIETVVHLGSALVDTDISAATIKVHYASQNGEPPRRITRSTTFDDLREANGLIITPAAAR